MKKLLACDIDGTLLHHRIDGNNIIYNVHQEDLKAIQEFRRQGNLFVFSTGRTLLGVKAVLNDFPIEADAAIVSGGARLHRFVQLNPLTTEHLIDFSLPSEMAQEIISHFYNQGECVLYWSDGHKDYAFEDRTSDWMKENSPTFITLEEWLAKPGDVSSIGLNPYTDYQAWMTKATHEIKSRWGQELECHQNVGTLDICHEGVNKGSALSHLSKILGGAYQCYAIGDAYNDLPMFVEVGREHSYLRGNGADKILPYVKRSVPTVAECIYDILEG